MDGAERTVRAWWNDCCRKFPEDFRDPDKRDRLLRELADRIRARCEEDEAALNRLGVKVDTLRARAEKAEQDLAAVVGTSGESVQEDFLRLRARVAELEALVREDRAVCLCGCPPERHEEYEEGQSCGDDRHSCLFVAPAVRALVAELEVKLADAQTALGNAFVAGAKWWEYKSTRGTMWSTDQERAANEAAMCKLPFRPILEVALEAKLDALLAAWDRANGNRGWMSCLEPHDGRCAYRAEGIGEGAACVCGATDLCAAIEAARKPAPGGEEKP